MLFELRSWLVDVFAALRLRRGLAALVAAAFVVAVGAAVAVNGSGPQDAPSAQRTLPSVTTLPKETPATVDPAACEHQVAGLFGATVDELVALASSDRALFDTMVLSAAPTSTQLWADCPDEMEAAVGAFGDALDGDRTVVDVLTGYRIVDGS